ncbi:MAG: hypothetical protein HY336_02650 [Candidatus Doudnabacteria bacterium]|nr:hypothetical protein [Candidatus Doudnabacteria bacterium]
MNNKKFAGIIGILAILLAAAFMLSSKKPSSENNNPQQSAQTQMPKFVLGSVVRVDGDKIFLNSEGEKTIITSSSTKLVKQVEAKDGTISLIESKLTDFKPGDEIVAYYSADPVDGQYQATKVQVIN